jgi:hypothetical protein
MEPFLSDPDWYQKYWYAPKPQKRVRRSAAVAVGVAAFALALLFR